MGSISQQQQKITLETLGLNLCYFHWIDLNTSGLIRFKLIQHNYSPIVVSTRDTFL